MEIRITDEAGKWFKDEMFLKNGDSIRFFVKYGGSSPVQEGFSLGISNEAPSDIAVHTEQGGIVYYIEEKDLWYFDDHHLYVSYDGDLDEPVYEYKKM
ncbi:HesB/YadR/YfhF family protein [Heyndrickxia sp. NPDC080065]|uniref:HesB/YadR/YfhF family protein n=1 Tax=Heyndrickxia sp. NPDC080065 TaxID=3390568 RepID=UPI003D03A994